MKKEPRLTKLKSLSVGAGQGAEGPLNIRDLEGLARPMDDKTETVTVRFAGAWLRVWKGVQAELPGMSPSEIIRQAVALRAALLALDAQGNKVSAELRFVDDTGNVRVVDLERHIGIAPRTQAPATEAGLPSLAVHENQVKNYGKV